MKNPSPSLASLVLASALAAVIGVVLFALSLQGKIAKAAQTRAQGEMARDQDRNVAQLHTLAQTTAPERTSLEGLLHADVLSIATMLTSAGKDAGVALEVSDAQPETAPTLKGNSFALHAIGFTVKGEGSFTKLMNAAALLEALPIAASIEHIDIIRMSAEKNAHAGPSWQINARIRVLTAAQISP